MLPRFMQTVSLPSAGFHRISRGLILLWLLLLTACHQAPSDEIQAYIRCVEARKAPPLDVADNRIEPTLPLRRISQQRSPFAPPQTASKTTRQSRSACRGCTGLTQFAPKELRMLGTLANTQTTHALLAAPDQQIYRVQIGDRLGPEQARITRISANGVTLEHSHTGEHGQRRHTYLQP